MCTCGSMNPGKTSFPEASTTSAPAGASRFFPMQVIVWSSTKISACSRAPTVTISPFLISKAIVASPRSVNMNPHLVPVRLHLLPVLGHLALLLRQFVPRHRSSFRRFFDHLNAVLHRANVEAQPATHAILFPHTHHRPRVDCRLFSVRAHIVSTGWHHASVLCDQVDALVRRIVARYIAEVATDASVLVNSRHGLERKIEILEF